MELTIWQVFVVAYLSGVISVVLSVWGLSFVWRRERAKKPKMTTIYLPWVIDERETVAVRDFLRTCRIVADMSKKPLVEVVQALNAFAEVFNLTPSFTRYQVGERIFRVQVENNDATTQDPEGFVH